MFMIDFLSVISWCGHSEALPSTAITSSSGSTTNPLPLSLLLLSLPLSPLLSLFILVLKWSASSQGPKRRRRRPRGTIACTAFMYFALACLPSALSLSAPFSFSCTGGGSQALVVLPVGISLLSVDDDYSAISSGTLSSSEEAADLDWFLSCSCSVACSSSEGGIAYDLNTTTTTTATVALPITGK